MAEALARELSPADRFSSAGLFADVDERAAAHAVEILQSKGIDLLAHRARLLDDEILKNAELVLCMTAEHRRALAAKFPEYTQRTHLLREFVGLDPVDVGDPFGGSLLDYQACLQALEESLRLLAGRKQTQTR